MKIEFCMEECTESLLSHAKFPAGLRMGYEF